MNHKEFREQCEDAGYLLQSPMKGTLSHRAFAFNEGFDVAIKGFQSAIRALPLPEVKQKPVAMINRNDERMELWKVMVQVLATCERIPHGDSYLYLASPDAENLRKENERLRELLESAANGLRWYQDSFPQAASEADDEMLARIDAELKGGAA